MAAEVTFDEFRAEWMKDIVEGSPSTVDLGNRFSRKIISQWLDVEEATDDLVYCDGSGDGGIDIAYLSREDPGADGAAAGGESEALVGNAWYLVQSKYGSAFAGTGTLLEEGQKVIDTLDGKKKRLSSLSEGLLERILNFRKQASERDRLCLVFATDGPLTEDQKRALSDVRAMGRARLGTIFDVDHVSVETIFKRMQELPADDSTLKVRLRANLLTAGNELLVGMIPLLDLFDFLKAYRSESGDLDQLYERNVRRFLGARGKINRAIKTTLDTAPERFGLYNNGITIVVEDFKPKENGTYILVEPYVVNGCQTTKTIWEVFQRRLDAGGTGTDPDLAAWTEKAKQGGVIVKVVKVGSGGDAQMVDITRFTNSQNAVRAQDFIALASGFPDWKRAMEGRDVFLEIQRGGWDSQKAFQKQNPSSRQFSKSANAFDLLKVYGAGWLAEPGTAYGRNAAFSPDGTIFKKILLAAGAGTFGVDDLYACYRLRIAADSFEFGRGAQSSRRQTRFLFYMVVIELLKDVMTFVPIERNGQLITHCVLALCRDGNEDAWRGLLDEAVQAIDEYLTNGQDDCVFVEPAFLDADQFNNDLNGFLKWDLLGKSDDSTPRLRSLISVHKKILGKPLGKNKSGKDAILAAIRGARAET